MIVFTQVRYRNMLSTGNVFTVVPLNTHKTTLIVGNNGHGKSTLLDAISFALFGRPFRKVNKAGLINSVNGKGCLVELDFTIGRLKYMITRGMEPDIFDIHVDGQLLNQEAKRDQQRYLETNILKFNQKAFNQIVILGSKSFVPFMKLIPFDRRPIIENLLDIGIFTLMNNVAKRDATDAREAVTGNKRAIDACKAQIALQSKYVEDSKRNNTETIAKLQAEIDTNNEQIDKLDAQEAALQTSANDLIQMVNDRSTVEANIKQLDQFEAKIEQNQNKAAKDWHFYNDNDHCPTCKQSIELQFKQQAMLVANNDVTRYGSALIQLENRKNRLNERLTEIQDTMKRYHAIMSEINRVQVSRKHIMDFTRKTMSEITKLQDKTVLSEDMMKVSKDLMDQLVNLTSNHKQLIENRAYYDVAVNLLKDDGIKAQIIKQYLPVINSLVNKYLAAMDFFVQFELNEQFVETIKSRHRDQFTYDSFSEGEKQKIDIALLFAWRAVAKMKNSVNTNLLILDEVFDSSLDGTGADLVLQILDAMPDGSNVFVISHRELLHDKFNHTIRFEKAGLFSQISTNEAA